MNFRPVSLIKVDSKLLATVLAFQLEKDFPKIIHKDQVGFIKGSSSADNMRRLMHLIWLNYRESEKEFDHVELDNFQQCQILVLEMVLCLVGLLFQNSRAAVITNGMTSPFLVVSGGTGQGSSPLLFMIVLELLASLIREDTNVVGIKGVADAPEANVVCR